MKRVGMVVAILLAVMLVAPAAFAQGDQGGGGGKGLAALAVAIGMGVAAFGCGLGQGRIASAACEGMARNPGAAGPIRAAMILGLVFVETLVLFTLAQGQAFRARRRVLSGLFSLGRVVLHPHIDFVRAPTYLAHL